MKNRKPGIVTLITDFGTGGEYVGAMKGAILKVNPCCQIVDITHQIRPQNTLQASFILKSVYPYFPGGTVHAVVVDPGVGTKRRAVVVQKDRHLFVGPDNGVFSGVLQGKGKTSGYEIREEKFFLTPVSYTFHGRDIFAPVAGLLSLGWKPSRLGPRIKDLVTLDWPQPILTRGKLQARILWADAFGNLQTNVTRQEFGPELEARAVKIKGKGWSIDRIHRTYREVLQGQPIALFGSGGLLEIFVNQGDAQKILGLKPGDPVTIFLK